MENNRIFTRLNKVAYKDEVKDYIIIKLPIEYSMAEEDDHENREGDFSGYMYLNGKAFMEHSDKNYDEVKNKLIKIVKEEYPMLQDASCIFE